jgi:hypothetical protein
VFIVPVMSGLVLVFSAYYIPVCVTHVSYLPLDPIVQ